VLLCIVIIRVMIQPTALAKCLVLVGKP